MTDDEIDKTEALVDLVLVAEQLAELMQDLKLKDQRNCLVMFAHLAKCYAGDDHALLIVGEEKSDKLFVYGINAQREIAVDMLASMHSHFVAMGEGEAAPHGALH